MFFDLNKASTAIVIGAGHGIGLAVVEELLKQASTAIVVASYRDQTKASALLVLAEEHSERLLVRQLDPTSESACEVFFSTVQGHIESVDLLINCVGALHGEGLSPEKSLQDIRFSALQQQFSVNAFVCPILAKYSFGLLRKSELSVFANLSAKVGSIGDNHLGGWYGYRASKAALNMFVKTVANEFRNRKVACISLAIHPGTTKTDLSKPYISRSKLLIHEPSDTAKNILAQIDGRKLEDSGKFFSWDGEVIPW